MNIPTETELRKPIVGADFDRVPSLEKQLIMCELKGLTTKATLLRGTLRAIKITMAAEKAMQARRRYPAS